MTLDVVDDQLAGPGTRNRPGEERSLDRAFALIGAEFENLTARIWLAFDNGRPLAACQDPLEDVLAAIARARAALEVER
jgi:hypothetical protein